MANVTVVPPEFALVDIQLDPQHAVITQFLGMLEETERRRAIKRSFAAWVPRNLDAGIDRIIHDSRCGYDHDAARFVLHAVWLLANAYIEAGYPDTDLGSELLHEQRVRQEAEKARKRNAFIDAFHEHDDDLDYARRQGDCDSISSHLELIERYVSEAPTRAARDRILHAVAASRSLQSAVAAIHTRSLEDNSGLSPDVRKRASKWQRYLEDVSLDKDFPV